MCLCLHLILWLHKELVAIYADIDVAGAGIGAGRTWDLEPLDLELMLEAFEILVVEATGAATSVGGGTGEGVAWDHVRPVFLVHVPVEIQHACTQIDFLSPCSASPRQIQRRSRRHSFFVSLLLEKPTEPTGLIWTYWSCCRRRHSGSPGTGRPLE